MPRVDQQAIDRIKASVQSAEDAVVSAETLIGSIAQEIRDANVDDTQDLDDLADSLDAKSNELAQAVVANTPADPSSNPQPIDPPTDAAHPESRAGAAAAGGYNAPGGAPANPEPTVSPTVPNLGAVDEADTNDTGDRITTQAGREAAGPFTGTGDQDAMRTSGTLGSSDQHHADERTGIDESAVPGNSEGTGTGDSAGTAEDTTASPSGTGDAGSAPTGASTSGAEGEGGAPSQPDTTDEGNDAA